MTNIPQHALFQANGAAMTTGNIVWRTWVLGHIFKGNFRGFTIMSSLCKCLSHFTLFYLMLPYFDIKAILW